MPTGTILIVNGTSSSGKTSIVQAFQEIAPEPFLDAGLDKFLWALPKRYLRPPLWAQVFEYAYSPEEPEVIASIQPGPLGGRLVSGMHRAAAGLARGGNPVILDHVLLEERWIRECARLFDPDRTYLIGVRCPLEVVEQRERERKDRTLGQARAQYHHVHRHCIYDLEVDTSLLGPGDCAQAIMEYIYANGRPSALRMLKERYAGSSRKKMEYGC